MKGSEDHKEAMLAEIDRISFLLSDQKSTSESRSTSSTQSSEEEQRPGTALAGSSMGYKHVMDRISDFIAKVTRKTKEDRDEDQVAETKTSVS